jgi:hypothetical protein
VYTAERISPLSRDAVLDFASRPAAEIRRRLDAGTALL